MSMFQTINSFLMFFERQRPINGYGTVAFFWPIGQLQLFTLATELCVTGFNVSPRAVVVSVIADLLRD